MNDLKENRTHAPLHVSPKTAGTNFNFLLPAEQVDFPNDPVKQALLAAQWDRNLTGFTEQGMAGNPWNATNASPITNYFNPKTMAVPEGTPTVPVTWTVFPNRINYYCRNLGQQNIYALADTGYQTDGKTSFPDIVNPCQPASSPAAYGPYGPRGWQDEYCEWSIARDDQGNITRIDLTCESPEYWNTLWMIDPQQVLMIYQTTLGKPQIKIADLYLTDANNNPVIDPSTGRPAYNPLNIWNSGTISNATQGGAMHLTSTPNTLQTDIGLANAATVQRTIGNSDPDQLICCAQYGQAKRNSDPHIGQAVNQTVGAGYNISLCNPPGLYMTLPDWAQYTFPAGTTWKDFYKITRGNETLFDQYGQQLPGNFILHAVFEAPEGHTIQEVLINKNGKKYPIVWAGQIAETINNQIVAYAITDQAPNPMPCVGTPAISFAAPLQLFHQVVFEAMSSYPIANPVQEPMTLISNSTMIAPILKAGRTFQLVLTCDVDLTQGMPSITSDNPGIAAAVVDAKPFKYAVPGNSYPSDCIAVFLNLYVAENAQPGLADLYLTNAGQKASVPMPALLTITA